MIKEDIENDAAEYLKTLTPDGWDDFENRPTYNAVQLVKAIYHGYEQGMKKVCEICEQHMLEEHPNACGCAFRRLGNEYCWEFK